MSSELKEAIRAVQVAQSNLIFLKASKAEKRITIARDVIAAIRLKWLIPQTMTYLDVDDGDLEERKINQCHACALGSVFVCALKRSQSVEPESQFEDDQTFMHEQLKPFFDTQQLLLIESAFERNDHVDETSDWEQDERKPIVKRAIAFGLRYDDPSRRLVAIMKNVVENNGRFVP